jgi:excisionase family DNA binding protein
MKTVEVKATSIDGLSAMYGIGKATVERAIKSGALPVARKGRRVVIRIKDAEEWIGESKPNVRRS